jgi:IK cytokine
MLEDFAGQGAEETLRLGAARGLDLAALERAKEQAAATDAVVGDDALEAAFAEATSGAKALPAETTEHAPTVKATKKKTRAEILAGLKASRTGASGAPNTDAANAKFKPIGFAPVGAPVKKKKKAADVADGAPNKKKRKGADGMPTSTSKPVLGHSEAQATNQTSAPTAGFMSEPADDFDIFAGAGEYTGMNFGDSDDDAPDVPPRDSSTVDAPPESIRKGGWFDEPEPEAKDEPELQAGASAIPPEGETGEIAPAQDGTEEPERLAPLAGSIIPSIRDILDADDAIGKEEKRRARKEKKKGKA